MRATRKGGILGAQSTPQTIALDAARRRAAENPRHPANQEVIDHFLAHFSPSCLVFRESLWPADKVLADALAAHGRLVYSPDMGAYSLPTLAGAEQRGRVTPSEARYGAAIARVDSATEAARNKALQALQSATTHLDRARGALERGETVASEDVGIVAQRLSAALLTLERYRALAEARNLLEAGM